MKSAMTIMAFILIGAGTVNAAYTYTYGPGDNFYSLDVAAGESILVNGGGGNTLGLRGIGLIESTSNPYPPGITDYDITGVVMGSSARLTVTGGDIGSIYVNDYSMLYLSGGDIRGLWSKLIGPINPNPAEMAIQFQYKTLTTQTSSRLIGTWEDDTPFDILLYNTPGYTSTFDNINFIYVPEPATLALLALGGLALRWKKRYAP